MLNLVTRVVTQPNETALYYALRSGTCDVAVSGLQLNPRRSQCGSMCPAMPQANSDCCIDYGAPYLFSSMSLLSKISVPASGDSVIQAFSSPALVNATLLVAAALLGAAWLLYIAERVVGKANREVSTPGTSLYWGVITLTTLGYGDVVPRSSLGRAVSMVWTLTAFITLGTLSALLTSALTSYNLASGQIDTLAGVKRDLCTMQADPDIDAFLAADVNAPTSLSRSDLADCVSNLLAGGSQAVLGYRPAITWLMNDASLPPLHLSPPLNALPLVFAYPAGSPLRAYTDAAVVSALTDPEWSPAVEGIKAIFMGVPLDGDAQVQEQINKACIVVVAVLGGMLLLFELFSVLHSVRKHGVTLPPWVPRAVSHCLLGRFEGIRLSKPSAAWDAEAGARSHAGSSRSPHANGGRASTEVLHAILAEAAALNNKLEALQAQLAGGGGGRGDDHSRSPAVSQSGSEATPVLERQTSRRNSLQTLVHAEVGLGSRGRERERERARSSDTAARREREASAASADDSITERL